MYETLAGGLLATSFRFPKSVLCECTVVQSKLTLFKVTSRTIIIITEEDVIKVIFSVIMNLFEGISQILFCFLRIIVFHIQREQDMR